MSELEDYIKYQKTATDINKDIKDGVFEVKSYEAAFAKIIIQTLTKIENTNELISELQETEPKEIPLINSYLTGLVHVMDIVEECAKELHDNGIE